MICSISITSAHVCKYAHTHTHLHTLLRVALDRVETRVVGVALVLKVPEAPRDCRDPKEGLDSPETSDQVEGWPACEITHLCLIVSLLPC